MIGIAEGLVGKPWAAQWLGLRAILGLNAEVDLTLQPEPLRGGGFGKRRLRTSRATAWLRFILCKLGVAAEEAKTLSAHSLKPTLLSLLAKRGDSIDERRLLGGHAKLDELMPLTYSRDALAGPLRTLSSALDDVRSGLFRPDVTRSGRWRPAASSPSTLPRAGAGSSRDTVAGPPNVTVEPFAAAPEVLALIAESDTAPAPLAAGTEAEAGTPAGDPRLREPAFAPFLVHG